MEYMSALQNDFDDLKPSLFELISEQQLSALLPPSLRYLLAVATHRYPRYLLRPLNSFDELYALLSLLVERYYIRTFGGSFTENFYSLKRERVLSTKNGEVPRAQIGAAGPVRDTLRLRDADVWKNLAVMVGLPYLKRKLDEGYDIHAAPHAALAAAGVEGGGPRYNPSEDLPARPTVKQRLMHYYKWFLRNVYPSINAGYYFSILAFNLAYLFDNTKYPSPFLWLIGARIRRLSSADHKAIAMVTQPPPARASPSASAGRARQSGLMNALSPQTLYPHLLGSLKMLLPASIFALKFLEWWHASDFSRQLARKATEALDLPAPVVSGMPAPSSRKTEKQQQQQQQSSTESTEKTAVPSHKRSQPPVSAASLLPILTVPVPQATTSSDNTCPICWSPLVNPTACQTGYVFCYTCIFRWVSGEHERQEQFMAGVGAGMQWEEDGEDNGDVDDEKERERDDGDDENTEAGGERSREGKWESGKGRCAVTGRRVLGGTEGLRRVLV